MASTAGEITNRWAVLAGHEKSQHELLDEPTLDSAAIYTRNIENFIGTVSLPVGIAGPLRVNGTYAQGDFYVPATTEAALVASYPAGRSSSPRPAARGHPASRGCQSRTGLRVRVAPRRRTVRGPGVARSPTCNASGIHDASRKAARHAREHRRHHVYLVFDFTTGEAEPGQNMVTIATQADLRVHRRARAPVKPVYSVHRSETIGR